MATLEAEEEKLTRARQEKAQKKAETAEPPKGLAATVVGEPITELDSEFQRKQQKKFEAQKKKQEEEERLLRQKAAAKSRPAGQEKDQGKKKGKKGASEQHSQAQLPPQPQQKQQQKPKAPETQEGPSFPEHSKEHEPAQPPSIRPPESHPANQTPKTLDPAFVASLREMGFSAERIRWAVTQSRNPNVIVELLTAPYLSDDEEEDETPESVGVASVGEEELDHYYDAHSSRPPSSDVATFTSPALPLAPEAIQPPTLLATPRPPTINTTYGQLFTPQFIRSPEPTFYQQQPIYQQQQATSQPQPQVDPFSYQPQPQSQPQLRVRPQRPARPAQGPPAPYAPVSTAPAPVPAVSPTVNVRPTGSRPYRPPQVFSQQAPAAASAQLRPPQVYQPVAAPQPAVIYQPLFTPVGQPQQQQPQGVPASYLPFLGGQNPYAAGDDLPNPYSQYLAQGQLPGSFFSFPASTQQQSPHHLQR